MPTIKLDSAHRRKLINCLKTFHLNIISPVRCSMIQIHRCYICDGFDTNQQSSLCSYLKSYERSNLVGYIACKKCESIVPLLLDLYEETGNYIPNAIYDNYNINARKVSFFRKSCSSDIAPYIETKAFIDINMFPVFNENSDNRLHVCICWNMMVPNMYGSDTITKTIHMANLIHHNRDIFGYSISEGPFSRCARIWHKNIIEEYVIANAFIEFSHIIYAHTNFDGLIKKLIYKYWRGALV
jgi:hypothetical protein